MTEKEREFKITKIQKYNDEINNQKTSWDTFKNCVGAFLIVCGIVDYLSNSLNDPMILFAASETIIGSLCITSGIKGIISKLTKKAGLEREVERLQDELAIDELNNEERGHSR